MTRKFNVAKVARPSNMEEILDGLGGFGKFQILMLVIVLGMEIPTAFLVFTPIVIGTLPEYWLCNNETVPASQICLCGGNITAIAREESIIAEWQLICGKAWVMDAITSLQLSGILVGNMVTGILSDWYGRRYTYVFIMIQMICATLLTALSPNPYVYSVARFMSGCSFSGFFSIAIVYTMEFMTPDWRLFSSSVGPFGIGTMFLGAVAYHVREWRFLILLTSIPMFLSFSVFFIIPESPRWLLRNQKLEECQKALDKVARINGTDTIHPDVIKEIAAKELQSIKLANQTEDGGEGKPKRFSILDFYRNSSLRRTTLCLQTLWFAWGIIYFGVSFNVRNLGLNLYLSIALLGLVDAVAHPTCLLLDKKLGRLQMLVIFMSLCALFLVSIAVLQLSMNLQGYEVLVGSLALLGKYGLSAARTPLRTLTGESFPTAIRSTGIGFAGSLTSAGAALAPQLVFLGTYWPSVPYFGFAAAGIIGCLTSVLLTETSGLALTDEVKANKKKVVQNLSISSIIPIEECNEKECKTRL